MERVEQVTVPTGDGLKRSRYFDTEGTFADRDYDIALEPVVHRRNVTTEGVALNHLDGGRFRVGEVVCEGIELCEPCSYLECHLEAQGVRGALVHRGGLRARILEGGALTAGDGIERIS